MWGRRFSRNPKPLGASPAASSIDAEEPTGRGSVRSAVEPSVFDVHGWSVRPSGVKQRVKRNRKQRAVVEKSILTHPPHVPWPLAGDHRFACFLSHYKIEAGMEASAAHARTPTPASLPPPARPF